MARLRGADPLALGDPLAGGDGGGHWFIRRSKSPWMAHRHHTATGHRPSEEHRAGASGEHRRTGHRGQVDTAMTRPEPELWRVESPDHGR